MKARRDLQIVPESNVHKSELTKSSVNKPGLAETEGMTLDEGSVQFRSEKQKKVSKRDMGIPKNADRGDGGFEVERMVRRWTEGTNLNGGYDIGRRYNGLVHSSGVDFSLKMAFVSRPKGVNNATLATNYVTAGGGLGVIFAWK